MSPKEALVATVAERLALAVRQGDARAIATCQAMLASIERRS